MVLWNFDEFGGGVLNLFKRFLNCFLTGTFKTLYKLIIYIGDYMVAFSSSCLKGRTTITLWNGGEAVNTIAAGHFLVHRLHSQRGGSSGFVHRLGMSFVISEKEF